MLSHLFLIQCDTPPLPGLDASLGSIPETRPIEGAGNVTVSIDRGTESYFRLDLSRIDENPYIRNGPAAAWCIAWNKAISTGITLEGVRLHATTGDQNLKAVNYLLSIRPSLMLGDPSITWREVQLAIWTLMPFPDFDLNRIRLSQLPPEFTDETGEPLFDMDMVERIVRHVRDYVGSFDYTRATAGGIIVETPGNVQPLIIETVESAWAYGHISFRSAAFRELFGIPGQAKGRWGWLFRFTEFGASTPLVAGGGRDNGSMQPEQAGTIVGRVGMERTGNLLRVTYTADPGYLLDELHLWAGCRTEDLPVAGPDGQGGHGGSGMHFVPGQAAPGDFPFRYSGPPVSVYSFTINLAPLACNEPLLVAAHAGRVLLVRHIDLPDPPVWRPEFSILSLRSSGIAAALDVNDAGQILGGSSILETDGRLTPLGFSAGYINNRGDVAGGSRIGLASGEQVSLDPVKQPFDRFIEDCRRDPHFFDAGSYVHIAGLNHLAATAGETGYGCVFWYSDDDVYIDEEYFMAFYRDEAGTASLLTEHPGFATALNDFGQVTGVDYNNPGQGFIWSGTTGAAGLAFGAGYRSARPWSVNNKAQIAGSILVMQAGDAAVQSNLLSRRPVPADRLAATLHDRVMHLTGARHGLDFGHVQEVLASSNGLTQNVLDNLLRGTPAWPGRDAARGLVLPASEPVEAARSVQTHPPARKHSADRPGRPANTAGVPLTSLPGEAARLANSVTYRSEAFVWDELDGMIPLGTPGGNWSTAFDINDLGQVVGYGSVGGGQWRAFYWDTANGMIELPGLGGNSLARAISNKGQIVGYSYDSDGTFHPVVWEISNVDALQRQLAGR